MRRTGAIALALTACITAGCSLAPEDRPTVVTTDVMGSGLPTTSMPQRTGIVEIYLVRDDRLVPVVRSGGTAADALALLARGPSTLDARAGLRTALPPQPLELVVDPTRPGVAVVKAGADFAALSGRDQLLAVAQLVWTITDVCCATGVVVQLDGRPISLPTDSGPTQRPVRRSDYRSVAPP